jgi:hypothetical protein
MKRLLLIVAIVLATILLAGCVEYKEITITENVYNLRDNIGVDGRFVLGSGSVESVPVYVYYVKQENGAFKLKYIDARVTDVYMDEDINPYLMQTIEVGYYSDGTSIPSCTGKEYYCTSDAVAYDFRDVVRGEFHVPRGTLVQAYSLGATG